MPWQHVCLYMIDAVHVCMTGVARLSPCMDRAFEVAAHQGQVAFRHHSWITLQSSHEDVVLWHGACK